MKKIFFIITFLLFGIVNSSMASSNVAYVSADEIFDKSVSWNIFKNNLKQHSINVKNIVIEKEEKIEVIWNKIKKMRDENGDVNEISKLEKEFQQKSLKLQKYLQNQKKQMDQRYISEKKKVQIKIKSIINKIAKDRNIEMIINTNSISFNSYVIYADKKLDITQQVLDELNKTKLNLKLNIDVNEGADYE